MRVSSRILPALLLLSGASQAQQLTNLLWPPRDIGPREVFGLNGCIQDGHLLAVQCFRDLENPFVRVYLREGANWIEDGRLTVSPRTPGDDAFDSLGSSIDIDGERVLVGGAGVHLFRRVRAREWKHEEIFAPDTPPVDDVGRSQVGRSVALGGDWIAVAADETVRLLRHDSQGWTSVQEISSHLPSWLDLDGDSLLLSESGRVRVFHRTQAQWNQEFELPVTGFPPFLPVDLDGDVLGLLASNSFQSWTRAGSGWLPSGNFSTSAYHVCVTEGRVYLNRSFPERLEVLARGATNWTQVDTILSPYPLTRLGQSVVSMSAAGPLVVVSSNKNPVEHIQGLVATYSVDPKTQATLTASHAQMELVGGKTLTLTLDAGPEKAGRLYLLRGSITGSSPGTRVLNARRPLNRTNDAYFEHSRAYGRLDGAGRAVVQIQLPTILPGEALAALKDRTLHHAFVVWEPGRGLTHVSNVTLTALVGRLH